MMCIIGLLVTGCVSKPVQEMEQVEQAEQVEVTNGSAITVEKEAELKVEKEGSKQLKITYKKL